MQPRLVSRAPLAAVSFAGLLVLPTVTSASQGCSPDWIPTFGTTGPSGDVDALVVFDDGSGAGPQLYAGGEFESAGGQQVSYIARWDGESWSPLGDGVSDHVYALAVCDDGSGAGPALYAGGIFEGAGGQLANGIARWDGKSWSPLGSGLAYGEGFNVTVTTLAVFDDGGGPALYAGGAFDHAGGIPVSNIAKWNGQSWSAVGSEVIGGGVGALAVFDDGSGAGPALYAGVGFASAPGLNHIARWDGQAWSALGSGLNGGVGDLVVFDDGSGAGPALYVGGGFNQAGGQSANYVARWNGQAWSALGSGMDDIIAALRVFDDGSGAGPALYAGGFFTHAGGQSANRIAKWNGQAWSALGSGVSGTVLPAVQALAAFDDGSGLGSALHVGGQFLESPAGDSYLAKWGCPAVSTIPGCFGNPAALSCSSNEASIGSAFHVSLSASQITSGLGALFFGLDGTGGAGCGLFAPGLGELLLALAPLPHQVGFGPLGAGLVGFALPVPDQPVLVGIEIAFQGAVVSFDPGQPLELSNGLGVTITQ